MATMTDNTVLKEAFKDAIREIVFENKEFLHEILVEAMEDVAMSHAIEEGEKSTAVDQKLFTICLTLQNENRIQVVLSKGPEFASS